MTLYALAMRLVRSKRELRAISPSQHQNILKESSTPHICDEKFRGAANKEIVSPYPYSQVVAIIYIFVRKFSFKLSVLDDPVVWCEKSHVVGSHE